MGRRGPARGGDVDRHRLHATGELLYLTGTQGPAVRVHDTDGNHARKLADAGISWVDRHTGVCHLVGPGLLVHLGPEVQDAGTATGRRTDGPSRPVRLVGLSGVVAETLLLHYRDRPIKVTELAGAAGVSPGLVSRILQRLEREDVLEAEGKGPKRRRRIVDAGKLLDLWADEDVRDPDVATALYAWAPSTKGLYRRLHELDEDAHFDWALAGIAAANLHAPTLTVTPAPQIWIRADVPPTEIADALDGDVVDQGGNLELWQREDNPSLWHATTLEKRGPGTGEQSAFRVVSAVRAYVESLHGSGRAPEVADSVRSGLGY